MAYNKAINDVIRELEYTQEPSATPMIPQWMDRAPRVYVDSAIGTGMSGGGGGYREYVPGSFPSGYPALYQLAQESESGASAPAMREELVRGEPSQMEGGRDVGRQIGHFFAKAARESVPGRLIGALDKAVKHPKGDFGKALLRNTKEGLMATPQGRLASDAVRAARQIGGGDMETAQIGGGDMEGGLSMADIGRVVKKARKFKASMIPVAGPMIEKVLKAKERATRARKGAPVPRSAVPRAVPVAPAVPKPRKSRAKPIPIVDAMPVTKEEALAQFPLPPSMVGQGILKKVRKVGRAALKKAEYVAKSPFVKGVGRAVVEASKNPLVQKLAVEGAKAALSGGKVDGRKARAAIVKRIMSERGISMIEASKAVKAEKLY